LDFHSPKKKDRLEIILFATISIQSKKFSFTSCFKEKLRAFHLKEKHYFSIITKEKTENP
jgi:hypothetical protein